MKQRILYLDVIRIWACLMIIAMHAPIPNTGTDSYVLSADSLLTAPGIGLFVMVSGALLLPANMPTGQFIKKRLGKILWPTLFWTFFYYIMAPFIEGVGQGKGIKSFMSIPFFPQFNSALWFIYMLAGLYLLAPILSAWIKNVRSRELKFYLILWGITMCYPLIRNYVWIDESHTGIFYYFGGYAGYFLLGYYLRNHINSIPLWKCLLLLIIPLGIATMIKLQNIRIDFYDLFWYLSIFVAMMCIAWFMLIKKIHVVYDDASNWHRYIILISNCCFGIYLVHVFVMHSLVWRCSVIQGLEGIMQIGAVSIITFIGSTLITWLISYLPWAEYIIGFKQKR